MDMTCVSNAATSGDPITKSSLSNVTVYIHEGIDGMLKLGE